MVNGRGIDDMDISGQGRPELCFVMPKLWRGHRRAASAASCSILACQDIVGCGSTGQTGKRQKVVVLRELQRAIIYTTR